MGFRTGAFAKVWEIREVSPAITRVKMSVPRRNKDTGAFETDFSGYVSMIGSARAKADKLRRGDRIRLGDVDVSTYYDRENNKDYTNFKCFSFEFAENYTSPYSYDRASDSPPERKEAASSTPVDSTPVEDLDEELPF